MAVPAAPAPGGDADADLRADCSACVGLCCVEPAFVASSEFAITKPARTPCPNLLPDARCGIHDRLPERGFRGCATFDCFGAGQRLVAQLGADEGPTAAMSDAFPTLRGVQELRWHLREAHRLSRDGLHDRVGELLAEADRAADREAAELATSEVGGLRRRASELLDEVSRAVRGTSGGPDRRRADLVGADLRRTPLRRTSLRGCLLLGADLRGADLTRADLLGADLRGADLRGAALAEALFLAQPQLDGAVGDDATTVPARLRRPARWSDAQPPARRSRSASMSSKRRSGSSRSSPNSSRS